MENKKKATIATKVAEGTDSKVPDDIKPLEFIQEVFKLLEKWSNQGEKRGFLLIATCDSLDKDSGCGLISGCCGDDEDLAKMTCGALENDKNFRKMIMDACILREQANK